MPEIQPEGPISRLPPKQWRLPVLALGLVLACLAVLWPIASVITWAVILAYVTWPLYRLLRRPFGKFQSAAAITMAIIVMCAVILPALWLFALITAELVSAYRSFGALLAEKPLVLPEIIGRIPWFGAQLQQQLDSFSAEPAGFGSQAAIWAQSWTSRIAAMAGGIGRSIGKLFLVMFTVFFLYRDGDSIIGQLRQLVRGAFGTGLDISNATHVPFILVMFGVIGGIASWGLVGLFVGPVVLAIGLSIVREWSMGENLKCA
jgi:predicted PurR-regulated permease PerM